MGYLHLRSGARQSPEKAQLLLSRDPWVATRMPSTKVVEQCVAFRVVKELCGLVTVCFEVRREGGGD